MAMALARPSEASALHDELPSCGWAEPRDKKAAAKGSAKATACLHYPLALQHRASWATNTAAFAFLASRPPAPPPSSEPPSSPRPPLAMACVQETPRRCLASEGAPIDGLPTELLDDVLASFPTPALLPLAGVCRRFHALVSRLLYRRLRRAVALARYQLILACYHPSAKISTPYLHCQYLGTDDLDGPADHDAPDNALHRIATMYSRFRPVPPSDADVHVRNYRAIRRTMNFFMLSDMASGGTAATALQTVAGAPARGGTPASPASLASPATSGDALPLVAYDVHLDEGELFSQLCTVTSLVRTGARPGLFLNCVNIDDGVIRVWRDWLSQRVRPAAAAAVAASPSATEAGGNQAIPSVVDTDQHILWAYTGKHVGMRFRVTEGDQPTDHENRFTRRATALVEEPAVSYQLEYEELLVRTYALLLAVETAAAQETAQSSRGVVVASL